MHIQNTYMCNLLQYLIATTELPVVCLLVFMLLEEYHLDPSFKYVPTDMKGL